MTNNYDTDEFGIRHIEYFKSGVLARARIAEEIMQLCEENLYPGGLCDRCYGSGDAFVEWVDMSDYYNVRDRIMHRLKHQL